MRRPLLLPLLLLLAACGRTVADGKGDATRPRTLPDAQPGAVPSVVFGPVDAPTSGEVVVGLLVPSPPSRRLVELVPPEVWEAFQAAEAARDPAADEAEDEDVAEEEVILESDWPEEEVEAARKRAEALRAAARVLEDRTHVRFRFQPVLAAELGALPLVLVEDRVSEPGDQEHVRAYLAAGGRVLLGNAPSPALGESRPGVVPSEPDRVDALVEACVETLATSPRIRHVPVDPRPVLEAHREGDEVRVRFAGVPEAATLCGLDDRVVADAGIAADGTVSVRAPDPELDPHAHRLVVTWDVEGVRLREGPRIVDLVGALERIVVAENVVEAGSAFAPHVLFRYGGASLDGRASERPAVGVEERIALVRDETVIAEATARTGEAGSLDVALAVPAGTTPGAAVLRVGEDSFPVTVKSGLRVHVTTERPLYRPTDTVSARVMVHAPGTGAPVAGAEVRLELRDVEKRVTTSEHGIASTTFRLVEARPGDTTLVAEVGGTQASAPVRIRAFEQPTFQVEADPAHLVLRPGEAVQVAVTARYVNDEPVVGARCESWGEEPLRARAKRGTTDAEGRSSLALRVLEDARSGSATIRVTDADGRWVDLALPVEVLRDEEPADADLVFLDDLVVGRPCRVQVRASKPGPVTVDLPDGSTRDVRVDATGASEELVLTPSTTKLSFGLHVDDGKAQTKTATAAAWDGESPLVVVDRRTALVGETLAVHVLGADGPAQVDVGRDGTLLRTRGVVVAGGEATFDLPLDPDLAGLLTLRAWRTAVDGDRCTSSRVTLLVARGRALDVRASAARSDYRPAETAEVDVEVRDRDGRPTAAVLGYWGVDEALLALRPWGPPAEEVFDVLGARPQADEAEVALAIERRRPVDPVRARALLGNVHTSGMSLDELAVHQVSSRAHEEAARTLAETTFHQGVSTLRKAWLAAFASVPLEEIRTSASLREQTLFLLRGGHLPPDAFLDPWGTPLALGHGLHVERHESRRSPRSWSWHEDLGIDVRSAGPDLVFGTADDLEDVWQEFWIEDVPGRLGRFLRFVRDHLEGAGFDELAPGVPLVPFWGPANNGLIGLGGGAGGAFGGRGGSRDLTTGGGGRRTGATVLHVRKDFEPTLCFVPEAIVGPEGRTRLEIPLKDSITTWRLRLVASDAAGATGVGEGRIRVTQPLHAEPWIAPYLTVGDELELPVAVRNETDEAMRVALRLGLSREVEAVGDVAADVAAAPHGTAAHVFRIRAVGPGSARVRVDAGAGDHRDAIERVVTVRRHAYGQTTVATGNLAADAPFTPSLEGLAADVPCDRRITLYPSTMAETLGGLEGLLTCPHG